jgi:hypothetical protein
VQVSNTTPPNNNSCVSQRYEEGEEWVYKKQIDFKVGGLHNLFTTLTGKWKFIVTEARVESDTFTSVFTGPTINVWYVPGNYYEFVSGQSLPNATFAPWQYTTISLRANSSTRKAAPENTIVYCNVTSAATWTAYTGTLFIKWHYQS